MPVHTYAMFHFLEILDANPIAQPVLRLLEPVVDCLSLHSKGTEKQSLVQIVGNTFTSLLVQVPCSRATEAMALHYLFVANPAAIGEDWQSTRHMEQYVPSEIRFQFRVETNGMQACEQKLT